MVLIMIVNANEIIEIIKCNSKFELGKIVITPRVLETISFVELINCIKRHSQCDWGIVCKETAEINNAALYTFDDVLSVYTSSGKEIWIITEPASGYTTVLFSEEY